MRLAVFSLFSSSAFDPEISCPLFNKDLKARCGLLEGWLGLFLSDRHRKPVGGRRCQTPSSAIGCWARLSAGCRAALHEDIELSFLVSILTHLSTQSLVSMVDPESGGGVRGSSILLLSKVDRWSIDQVMLLPFKVVKNFGIRHYIATKFATNLVFFCDFNGKSGF